MNIQIHWLIPALYWITGVAFGYAFYVILARARTSEAQRSASNILADAQRERDNLLREAGIQSQQQVLEARQAFDKSTLERRQELERLEQRALARSAELEQRAAELERRQQDAEALEQRLQGERDRVAGLTTEQARQEQRVRAEAELKEELATLVRRTQEEARTQSQAEARRIIAMAIERHAADQSSEMTTATVRLPDDDLKARVIGKEGRNIRAFEAATGTNLVIDDTPETVVVSCFDPVRREVARIALERLIADGRIHPAHIEAMVSTVQGEVEAEVRKAGEAALQDLGLTDVAPAIVQLLGRLKYRHSYGQNVIKHSIEMGHLMGLMAAELGADTSIAKRAGLLHDIGKAMDHQAGGSHATAGAEFLRRHGENAVVCNAVAAHHNEVESESLYAVLTKAADAITAARPGARQESTEIYLKRLEKLEEIGRSFPGVEKCFAIQAGRELRVIVEPAKISDADALLLARNIGRAIEQQLEYPGAIKITVVRETRVVEYAR